MFGRSYGERKVSDVGDLVANRATASESGSLTFAAVAEARKHFTAVCPNCGEGPVKSFAKPRLAK
eukprot:10251254-Alexandrium_andersonii.AAC.1